MIKVVAWDFDGVLNRSWADGAFVWQNDFARDIGHSLQSYHEHVFAEDFHRVITGREDVRVRIQRWVDHVRATKTPDEILAYWFAKDARPDPETVALMNELSAKGVRQVIATNNEQHRTRYIAEDMGFGARVERVFASGHIGISKPDPGFFEHVAQELAVPPADILLIDDRENNIRAARKSGWQGFHFTDETRGTLRRYLSALIV